MRSGGQKNRENEDLVPLARQKRVEGGLPIRSRFGRFRADSVGFVASFRADSVGFGASFRADSVDFVARFRADTKDETQKKPDSSIGGSGSTIARRRALLTCS